MDLDPLARLGRRLKGAAQTINLGADIFLADVAGRYIGRICDYRECHPRVACRALSCGLRQHLNDDLQVVTLSPTLVTAPPIELWPRIVIRCAVPADTHALLLAKLDEEPHKTRSPPNASAPSAQRGSPENAGLESSAHPGIRQSSEAIRIRYALVAPYYLCEVIARRPHVTSEFSSPVPVSAPQGSQQHAMCGLALAAYCRPD